jgi:hypothetical protein
MTSYPDPHSPYHWTQNQPSDLPSCEWELYTPARAGAILDVQRQAEDSITLVRRHEDSKGTESSRVVTYRSDFLSNRWMPNGATISFTAPMQLDCFPYPIPIPLDGGNRLQAIAGIEDDLFQAWLLTARNISIPAIPTIDSGWSRTLRHHMIAAGLSPDPREDSTLRAWWCLQNDAYNKPAVIVGSVSELLELRTRTPVIMKATELGNNLARVIHGSPTAWGAAWLVLREVNSDKAEEFFRKLQTGEMLPQRDPVLWLRNYTMSPEGRKKQAAMGPKRIQWSLGIIFRTWDRWMAGDSVDFVRYHPSGPARTKQFPYPEGWIPKPTRTEQE